MTGDEAEEHSTAAGLVLNVWGTVTIDDVAQRVKLERSGDSFLMITEENGRVFDTWLETVDDARAEIARLRPRWER